MIRNLDFVLVVCSLRSFKGFLSRGQHSDSYILERSLCLHWVFAIGQVLKTRKIEQSWSEEGKCWVWILTFWVWDDSQASIKQLDTRMWRSVEIPRLECQFGSHQSMDDFGSHGREGVWYVRRPRKNLSKVNIEKNGRIEAHLEDQKERMKFGETLNVDYTDTSFALHLRYGERVKPTSVGGIWQINCSWGFVEAVWHNVEAHLLWGLSVLVWKLVIVLISGIWAG